MSRYYEMSVEISGHRPEAADAVRQAAEEEWPFEDWDDRHEKLTASGRDSLYGSQSEEAFAERLSLAVWLANGAYCQVTVQATYLEDLPCGTYSLSEADYARLVGTGEDE
jgi:hypothetical protein